MNIRKLIEQALHEARDEFAEIVQRKLEALMGDAEPVSKRPGRPKKIVSASLGSKTARAERGSKRTRAPESHMAELRSRVLAGMPVGEPLKRSRIIELAGLTGEDGARVAAVLRKLKEDGVLVMRGAKASATYTRKA